VPKIQFTIKAKNDKDYLKLNGKLVPPPDTKPHNFQIAATVATGIIAVKGSKVGLKHLGGKDYQLTFE
jgi:hypothetical protein